MIVKNEHHVIERVLNSVYKHIDYWVIVDTGSTDGTQDIIKDFFIDKGITGELIEIEWKDFATSRNVALEAVEKKCKWGFWIDADEELILEDKGFNMKSSLSLGENDDSISLNIKYGNIEYTRKSIWKCDIGYKWNGPIHEVLERENEKPGGLVPFAHILVKAEGSSWNNIPEKYAGHAKILAEYTKENSDPRWIFYTAQSYRDAGNFTESIEWYKKRALILSGFEEEIFMSKLMIAKLADILDLPGNEILAYYNDAQLCDPLRGEAIKGLVLYLQRIKNWELAYIYSSYGLKYNMKNPYPNRILFIDDSFYRYQALELHSLSCFYTNRGEEASKTYWQMRVQLPNTLDNDQVKTILDNEKYFKMPVPTSVQRKGFRIPPKKKRK